MPNRSLTRPSIWLINDRVIHNFLDIKAVKFDVREPSTVYVVFMVPQLTYVVSLTETFDLA